MGRVFARKVVTRLFCLLLLLAVGVTPLAVIAQQPQPPTAEKVVRVGWFSYADYQGVSADGGYSGYNYDYLMRIARETGWKYEFVEAEWKDCLTMLQTGEIDLMGSIFWDAARQKTLAFPDFDCGTAYTSLCVSGESPLFADDFSNFEDVHIAGMEQTRCWADLAAFAEKEKFSYTALSYPTLELAMAAVQNGEADAVIFGGFPSQDGFRTVARFAPSRFYFATGKRNTVILEELNQALAEISIADPYFDSNLTMRYNRQKSLPLAFTEGEKRYLKTAPTLRVLCSGDWIPLEKIDPKTGEFSGMVAGIFEEISISTGLTFTFIRADSEAVIEQKIREGEADLIASFEGGREEAREIGVVLSDPYFYLPMVVVSDPRASPEVANVAAGVQQSFLQNSALSEEYRFVLYSSDALCMRALQEGEVGQVLLNGYTANQYLSERRATQWRVAPLQGLDLDMKIGVNQTIDPVLVSILDKAIMQIGEAQSNTIILENTTLSTENSLVSAINRLPVYVVLIFSGFLLLIILVLSRVIVNHSRGAHTINTLLYYDSLTGLLNQRGFEKEARRALDAAPKGSCYILVHFDINSFEVYNSLYGFEGGDRLLRIIAAVVAGDDLAQPSARLASDNFVKLTQAQDMADMVERTVAFNEEIVRATGDQTVLLSYGLYEITDRSLSISAMCDMASTAKRKVKGNYERFIGIYDEQMRHRQLDETLLVSWMEQALSAGEFVPYYQPKYDTRSRSIAGAEALVRWIRPNGEVISPARFIDLFEKNGLIARLDRYIFQQVCKQIVALQQQGITPVPISVNFSRVHLLDENFAATLAQICREQQVSTSLLEIELTESAFVVPTEILSRVIDELHQMGFLVSMDDFGSGFSSLNMLKDMYFDTIKLDGEFLSETSETARGQKVIESILFLTRRLRLKTVAEGVETSEQVAFLQAHGCDQIQGYYFSRPVPAAEFVDLLAAGTNAAAFGVASASAEQSESIKKGEEIGILEMREMLGAMAALYSMIVSSNLTQNCYSILECDQSSTWCVQNAEDFDTLFARGVESVHPEDQGVFRDALSRDSLLSAYAQGQQQVRVVVRQHNEQGEYVKSETWVVFVEDPRNKDVLGLTFFRAIEETEPIVLPKRWRSLHKEAVAADSF